MKSEKPTTSPVTYWTPLAIVGIAVLTVLGIASLVSLFAFDAPGALDDLLAAGALGVSALGLVFTAWRMMAEPPERERKPRRVRRDVSAALVEAVGDLVALTEEVRAGRINGDDLAVDDARAEVFALMRAAYEVGNAPGAEALLAAYEELLAALPTSANG